MASSQLTDSVIFQDLLSEESADASEIFFEAANEKSVGYRTQTGDVVVVNQNQLVENSTGGVVWETSYFLATFLETSDAHRKAGMSVLEVGAGCGLLGLVLAHLGCNVICTECTENFDVLHKNIRGFDEKVNRVCKGSISAELLRWEVPSDKDAFSRTKFDLIVGTDVIFSAALVSPLLSTMHSFSNEDTVIWLCFQIRCADAHAELMKIAPSFFDVIDDFSDALKETPGCCSARQLDCWLLRLSSPRLISHTSDSIEDQLVSARNSTSKTKKPRYSSNRDPNS